MKNLKFNISWWEIKRWFYDNELIFCASCGKITRRKNTQHEVTLTGVTARICKDCHIKYFGEQ